MLPADDYYAFFMREIVRDVPGDYGVFLPMQTWEEVTDKFVHQLERCELFRGLMVNVLTVLLSFKNSHFPVLYTYLLYLLNNLFCVQFN